MSAIYLLEPGGQQTLYSDEQARELWSQGRVSPQALYWKEGMAEWRPASEFFGAGQGMPPAGVAAQFAPSVYAAHQPVRAFAKDPRTLTKFLKVMLWISFSLGVVGLLISGVSLATGNALKSSDDELNLFVLFEGLFALLQVVVYIVTAIPFLMWIHRANRNARALGAQGMTFSPGWSVGWFFIPILNIWKPYQAMKQIWQASANPDAWSSEPVPSLVGNWWGLWLLSNFLGQMSVRLAFRDETAQILMTSAIVDLGTEAVDIALCLVALRLISSIFRMQCERAGQAA